MAGHCEKPKRDPDFAFERGIKTPHTISRLQRDPARFSRTSPSRYRMLLHGKREVPETAHLLLQVRTQTLNGTLRETFQRLVGADRTGGERRPCLQTELIIRACCNKLTSAPVGFKSSKPQDIANWRVHLSGNLTRVRQVCIHECRLSRVLCAGF